ALPGEIAYEDPVLARTLGPEGNPAAVRRDRQDLDLVSNARIEADVLGEVDREAREVPGRRRGSADERHGGDDGRGGDQPGDPGEHPRPTRRYGGLRFGLPSGRAKRLFDLETGVGNVVEPALRVPLETAVEEANDPAWRLLRERGVVHVLAQDG